VLGRADTIVLDKTHRLTIAQVAHHDRLDIEGERRDGTVVSAAVSIERAADLSLADEIELRAYFISYADRECEERPLKRAADAWDPWTEVLECRSPHGAVALDGENAMVAHLDARRRFRRMCATLSRLSANDREVLDAYSRNKPCEHALGQLAAVAKLTETATRRNRARAARGIHEPIEVTVRRLAAATTAHLRAAHTAMKSEAATLLRRTRRAYASTRAEAVNALRCERHPSEEAPA
jgi:hypothetical protein